MPSIILNKPFNTLCQFSAEAGSARPTLAQWVTVPDVYPAGRLDADSEGLLLLTDDGKLQARVAQAAGVAGAIGAKGHGGKLWKTYLAQVEGSPSDEDIQRLAEGLVLKDGPTQPAKARLCDEPAWLWPRNPPIRERASIPTTWIELQLAEGRNRQVRRMTAAIGFPTLRLIRTGIGPLQLVESGRPLSLGAWRELRPFEIKRLWQARR